VLQEQKKFADSYEIAKRIARYYPANPKRLSTVLKLAIMTKNLEDIERYYQIFLNIDQKEEELIQYVCAALVVCGKQYLKTSFQFRGLELLNNAAKTAGKRLKYQREILLTMIAQRFIKEAQEVFKQIPIDAKSIPDYPLIEYLMIDQDNVPAKMVEIGAGYLSNPSLPFLKEPLFYQIIIKNLFKMGDLVKAEALEKEASTLHPKLAQTFRDALKGELKFS
jgi:hypothetical protein